MKIQRTCPDCGSPALPVGDDFYFCEQCDGTIHLPPAAATKEKNELSNRVRVIEDECTGCGVCEVIAPEVFVMENDVAEVIEEGIDGNEEAIREAAEECPDDCIKLNL